MNKFNSDLAIVATDVSLDWSSSSTLYALFMSIIDRKTKIGHKMKIKAITQQFLVAFTKFSSVGAGVSTREAISALN